MNSHSPFNGAQCKASRLVLLVLEDGHAAVLILEGTVDLLLRTNKICIPHNTPAQRWSVHAPMPGCGARPHTPE